MHIFTNELESRPECGESSMALKFNSSIQKKRVAQAKG